MTIDQTKNYKIKKNFRVKFMRNMRLGTFSLTKYISRNFPKILMYHKFGATSTRRYLGHVELENQIAIIKRHFHVVSLSTLVKIIESKGQVHPNTIVITVDDGYIDFYRFAFPLLKKYSVPATLYITTDFIDQKIWLWPDVIDYILRSTNFRNYSFFMEGVKRDYDLTREESRFKAWNDIADYCLTLKRKNIEETLKNIANELKVNVPTEPVEEYRALTWAQIREMKKSNIEIGSHTCTHPRLVVMDDSDLFREITNSKSRIEDMINDTVDSFCYPYGRKVDINDKIKSIVRNAGYKNATVAYCERNGIHDLFELGRYGVGSDMLDFKKKIYGVKFLLNGLNKL